MQVRTFSSQIWAIGGVSLARSLSGAFTMATLLPSTAGGVLRGADVPVPHYILQWKKVYKWPYPVISQVKRASFMLNRRRLRGDRGCTNRRSYQNYGSIGLNSFLSSLFSSGSLRRYSFSTQLKCGHSGQMKGSHECLCSPQEIVAPITSLEYGEENEAVDALDEFEDVLDAGCIHQDSLNLLDWSAICAQVAQFACTPMGISIARDANLAIGANKEQSEALLEQTADAFALARPIEFSGIENLQGIVAEAIAGSVCQTKEFCSVKNTLTRLQLIHDQLCSSDSEDLRSSHSNAKKCSSLETLMSNCDLCSDLLREIDHCLDCSLNTVHDRASPALEIARLRRQENMKALQALLKETASWIVQKGGMDSVIVTRRRTRLCIAVRSSHKSLLPGGVVLDISNSGATSFMEPEPALALNNEENRLAAVEKAEEIAVLKTLTFKLVDKADSIMDLLGRITVVDLGCARASHAKWLGSVCPLFYNKLESLSIPTVREPDEQSLSENIFSENCTQAGEYEHFMVDIMGMRHPLLLGAVLPDLAPSQRCGTVQSSSSLQRSSPVLVDNLVVQKTMNLPVPIDIKVNSKVRVVTITGPNTGGKTATLKTLGIAAIMAKAGLYLPAEGQPKLPWFDMVLADVGDAQSLERSLSTFSGHIKRLCALLAICTDQSFVLLDEVGGGTDPSEGAALARAVLQHLCSRVLLTVATTHSAELKSLKDQDSRFENASVEFDTKSFKPTYRVLWGLAGQSSALDIAESLRFDMRVVTHAREIVGNILPSELGVRTAKILVPLTKQRNEMLERSRRAVVVLSKAQELHHELKAAANNLPKRVADWRRLEEQAIQNGIASARLRMEQVIKQFQDVMEQDRGDGRSPSLRESQAEIALILEEFMLRERSTPFQHLFSGDAVLESSVHQSHAAEQLSVGDKVQVKSLGKTPVTVIELPQKDTDFLTVQLGTLKMQVRSRGVLKTRRSGPGSTPAIPARMPNKPRKGIMNSRTSEADSSEPKYQATVQTSKNTLDLRGMRVDDAIRELLITLASKSPGFVLFVVHGIGTGAVKEAVHQALRKHSFVAKFEEESLTNAGCSIVYVK